MCHSICYSPLDGNTDTNSLPAGPPKTISKLLFNVKVSCNLLPGENGL